MTWELILKRRIKIQFKELKAVLKDWSNNNKHREVSTEQVMGEILDDYTGRLNFSPQGKSTHRRTIINGPHAFRQGIGKILISMGWERKPSYGISVYYFR